MSKGYEMIADGLKMMAKGYELLAGAGGAEQAKKAKLKKEEVQAVTDTPQADAPRDTPKTDVKDVRAMMRQKIKDGKMEACQEVLRSFGCEKLTDVPEDRLSELMQKVEVL